MKTKVRVLFGAVVFAFLAAACSNPAAEAPKTETGRILVNIGIAGEAALEPAGSRSAAARWEGSPARTVVPTGLSTGTFSKVEALFTATGGGTNQGPTVISGGAATVDLAVGTYTVTITAYTGSVGSYTAAAEGSVSGVVITQAQPSSVDVLLGPKTGSGTGTFTYDLTVPAGAGGTLTITPFGVTGSGTTKSLSAGGNTDSITLSAGYYEVVVSLTKGSDSAGFPEIVHIYPGLTSALAPQTFTDGDFTATAPVDDFNLSGDFAAPATGAAPAGTLSAIQYTGAITWNPAVSGTFAADTAYTATVTLTAKPGYSLSGVGANVFSYTGASSVTNTAGNTGSVVVTIGFGATTTPSANTGQAGTSYAVDNGIIAVTADPANKIIQQGGTGLVLTVPTGYTVTGWYIDGVIAALGTALSVTLDPDDYDAKPHSVSVFAEKGGRPYSWRDTFTVEAAGGGGGTPLSLEAFIAAAQAVAPNTPETPVTLALDAAVELSNSTAMTSLKTALASLNNQYIVIDLSSHTFTTMAEADGNTPYSLCFTQPAVVSVTLPSTLTTIGAAAFLNGEDPSLAGLRSITIPAGVISIGDYAFAECSNLTRVTFGGNLITNLGDTVFPPGFAAIYNAASPKTGTYVKTGQTTWSKQ